MRRTIVIVATTLLTIVLAGPAQAAVLEYEGCYEVSIARARPKALIEQALPPGFTAAPFLDPALGLGAYAIVGYECAVGSGMVSELISGVVVNPPPEFAGASQTLLLDRATTSRRLSASLYHAWCLDSFEHGDVTVDHEVTALTRSASIAAEHSRGDISATSVAPAPTPNAGPETRLRILDVGINSVGILDLDATAAVYSIGAAIVTLDGIVEPAPALHIVAGGEAAPNTWSLSGRCVRSRP